MYRLLILCSLLAGCASIFDPPFKPEFIRENPEIVVTRLDTEEQMDEACGGIPKEGYQRLGCARVPFYEDFPCYVYIYENSPLRILDHEIKHCKYGAWHP